MQTAAEYFGFSRGPTTEQLSALPQPPTTLHAIEGQVDDSVIRHPAVALFGLVLVTAVLLERTTRPVAGGRVEAHVGRAHGGVEAEL